MKKWLVTCLLAIALLFVATTAMAAHIRLNGDYCEGNTFEIRKREKDYHTLYCYRCYDEFTENHWSIDTPQYKATCTKVAVCTSCLMSYGEYGPHDWGAWQSRGNNSEHIRHCQRDGCDAEQTAGCSGDSSATCITLGTCTTCGGQYYSAHTFPANQSWDSDAENHWVSCTVCHEAKTKVGAHLFVQGNDSSCLKSAATCVSPPVYYTNCAYCYRKGTDTYVHPWYGPDPNNHDLVHHDAKAPTCTEIGWDAYDACQREGCTYTTKVEIPALKHKLVHHDAKAPTCTETGWEEYDTCSRCDYTTKVELLAPASVRAAITPPRWKSLPPGTIIPKRSSSPPAERAATRCTPAKNAMTAIRITRRRRCCTGMANGRVTATARTARPASARIASTSARPNAPSSNSSRLKRRARSAPYAAM